MIVALQAFIAAYPVVAAILIAILVVMVMLVAVTAIGLRQLPPDTMSECDAPITARDDLAAGIRPTASKPLPWNRAGGNWWPIP